MNTILVGVDGSDASTEAVRWAARTAALEHADLSLVGVYDASTSDYAPGLIIPQDVIEAIRRDATDAVSEAAVTAADAAPGVEVTASVVDGDAAKVLLDLGADADAIVLGTRGLGAIKGLFFGSVSTTVAAHSHGRVVVVTGPAGDGPVVLGVDDSPVSDPAVAEAFRQASLRERPLVVVHTWAPLDTDALHGYGIDTGEIERVSQDAVEGVAERLAGYAQDYPDVQVERRVLPAEPARAILETAGDEAALIIVGSRGRGGFTGLLLGSTSQKVLHHAQVPVMVVRT
ncbi:universal stress protein [Gordonia sinesedis]